jgi:hypothetical protein
LDETLTFYMEHNFQNIETSVNTEFNKIKKFTNNIINKFKSGKYKKVVQGN